MKTVTGIFNSRAAAQDTFKRLQQAAFKDTDISFLTPETSEAELKAIPTTEGEQPGMGSALGGVVGGAIGLSGGIQVAAAISSVLLPGLGSVLAIGFAGAALAGAAGAIAGAKAGSLAEDALTEGLPKDELYFYIEELKKGRTVIVCRTDDDSKLETARQILDASAQRVDAAREQRWIGVEDTPEARK
jgi:outer membrane lipoprotein SlyB